MQHTPLLKPQSLARQVIQLLYQEIRSHKKEGRDFTGGH